MREDIKYILEALEIKSTSVNLFKTELMNILDNPLGLMEFANKLKKEIYFTKDTPDDRVPFYDLFLAIALQGNNIETAKETLSKAVHDFRIQDHDLNEALGEWIFSTFHFENKKYERAERACETAIGIMQNLITRYEEARKYEKAREIKRHLSHLLIYQKVITISPTVENAKDETEKPGSSDPEDPSPEPPSVPTLLKARRQAIYDELKNILADLQNKKQRIPLTLVAAIFYLYRTITPAHSVYSTVPTPKTKREETAYKTLLAKVGFFEVIEQLVELEREFEPTARREEILEKINLAWDQEVSQ